MKKAMAILALSVLLFSYESEPKKETASTPQYIKEYNAGVAAQKDKNYAVAIQHYQKALDQKSDFPDAWNNLGHCYRMTAKAYLVRCGSAYDKALKYDPKYEEALEYQGEYFVMVGQMKKAYSNYQKLVQMSSEEAGDLKAALDAVLKEAQSVLKEYSP